MSSKGEGPRWLPWIVVLVVMPLVLCGGVVTWWVGRNAMARSELDARVQRLRSQGKPVDNETLAEFHRSATDDRHTAAWLKILSTLESEEVTRESANLPHIGDGPDPPPLDQPWPEQQEVAEFLTKYRPTIEELHRIARSDRPVRFPIKFESFDTLLPHIQGMRHTARLLLLEHEMAMRTGDAQAASDALHSLLGTSFALRGEPILVSYLVSLAIHGAALGAVKDSVERGLLTEDQWVSLVERMKIFENYAAHFQLAMAGERGMALPLFENPGMLIETESISRFGARPIDAVAYLETMERIETLRAEDLDAFVQEAVQISEAYEDAGLLRTMDTVMASLALPAIEASAEATGRMVMSNRIAILGLGIRQFERKHDRLPASLGELSAIGMDVSQYPPLGDRPFGYRVEDGEAVLWGFAPPPSTGGLTNVPATPPPTSDPNGENAYWVWTIPAIEP